MRPLRIPLICLDGDDVAAKRAEIRYVFHETFSLYERLFEHLATPEAWYEQAITLRHPLIFYFGHTATFYVNKFQVAGLITERLNPTLEAVFAVGVDEMSWDDLDLHEVAWPSVSEVRAYRAQVRALVDETINTLPLTLPIGMDSPWWVILMGIEHENIHLETSSVLIRQLPLSRVRPVAEFAPWADAAEAPTNALIPAPGGLVVAGKERRHPLYGWDNEYGRHEAMLRGFAASRYLVSNGEFRAFVEAGGYTQSQWWSEEGGRWQEFACARHPTFWVEGFEGWKLRLLACERPMPWNWPVEVNCHEAQAFCAWKSAQTGCSLRLPSEDEWRRLRDMSGLSEGDQWTDVPANTGLAHGASPCAVDRFRHGAFYDVVGNVWQWTVTPIYPYEGFATHPHYDDFSVPTFDQQHNLMKGGSFMSLGDETQVEARYAFRRHFFQHAGFRYVESPNALPEVPVYETDEAVSQYLEFHYGAQHFGVANFPAAVAAVAVAAMRGRPMRRALDLGCAVGRTSFELARAFESVTGLDFSIRFIQVGTRLRAAGQYTYTLPVEGEIKSHHAVQFEELGLAERAQVVEFFQADACNLKPHFRGYDLVVAANLIDRLYQPRRFLEDIGARINPGGLLVLTSPYTWLMEHTPRDEWLGGFKKHGETWTTFDALQEILRREFRLLPDCPLDLPFVIRETARKFQHSVAQVTLWERL
ncbi:MAG: 5-histidylcysteine sulfoxide synthase [Acidiferrobacter sp.]